MSKNSIEIKQLYYKLTFNDIKNFISEVIL